MRFRFHWKRVRVLRMCVLIVNVFLIHRADSIVHSASETTRSTWFLNCSSSSSSSNATIQSMNLEARLHACFTDNPYDTSQLPVTPTTDSSTANASRVLELFYDYSVIKLVDFQYSRMTLFGQLSLRWRDYYRQWDTKEIQVPYVQVPLSEIWYPQVQFVSSLTRRSLKLLEKDDVAVLFPSEVRLLRRNVLEAHCEVDYRRFPFDTQVCALHFELERYFFDREVNVLLDRENYTYRFSESLNDDWELLSVASEPVNTSFQRVVVNTTDRLGANQVSEYTEPNVRTGFLLSLTLRRYPQYYMINFIGPTILLSVVSQVAFAIPERADGKLEVPLTVLLGFMFLQGIVADELPRSQTTPLVALYVISCVLLSALNFLACGVTVWVANVNVDVPDAFRHLLNAAEFVLFPSRLISLLHRTKTKPTCTRSQYPVFVSFPRLYPGLFTIAAAAAANNNSNLNPDERNANSLSGVKKANGEKYFERVAMVLNRLFGLLHAAAIITCFCLFLFPLLIN